MNDKHQQQQGGAKRKEEPPPEKNPPHVSSGKFVSKKKGPAQRVPSKHDPETEFSE